MMVTLAVLTQFSANTAAAPLVAGTATAAGKGGEPLYKIVGDCEYSESNRAIIGSTKVGNGYNIVRNQDGGDSYPLLNTYSFDQKGAILMKYVLPGSTDGPRSECFNVPDAFYTAGVAMGVDPTQVGWDMSFSSEAGYSTRSLQQEMASSHESSYSGSVKYLSVASAESAYTRSDSISTMTREESTESSNAIHMYSSGSFYGLNLLNPNPTEKAIEAWLDLNKKDKKDQKAFDSYFEAFGTHYYQSGIMGGNLMIEIFASASTTENGKSQARDQADCLSAKASAKFWGVDGSAATKVCEKSSAVSDSSASFEKLYNKCTVRCQGGICNGSNDVCNANESDPEKALKAFTDWQASVFTSPSVLPGKSKYDWITALLASSYPSKASVVERIGGQANYDAFTENMQKRLKDYLTNNNYCTVYNNCGGVDLKYVEYKAPWNTSKFVNKNFLASEGDSVIFRMNTPIYKDIMVPISTFFYLPTSKKLVAYESNKCLGANPKTMEIKAVPCVWNGDNSGNVVDRDGFVQSGWTFSQKQLRLANQNLCLVTAEWDTRNLKQNLQVKLDTCSMSDRSELTLHNADDGTFKPFLDNYVDHIQIGSSFPWIPDSVSVF
jgi:hypothetical protein